MGAVLTEDYLIQRGAVLDRVLGHIRQQKEMLDRVVLTSETHMQQTPQEPHEALRLLAAGFQRLKDQTAPEPALRCAIGPALSDISLRRSSIAVALGVLAPVFETLFVPVSFDSGHDEGLFLAQRLIEAADADFEKSTLLIRQMMFADTVVSSALKQDVQHETYFRDVMRQSFVLLSESYRNGCLEIRQILQE